jgi:hypothetical protein
LCVWWVASFLPPFVWRCQNATTDDLPPFLPLFFEVAKSRRHRVCRRLFLALFLVTTKCHGKHPPSIHTFATTKSTL